MSLPPSQELIEESRRRLGIPDNWGHVMCAAQCGEMVWYPPGVKEAAEAIGKTPIIFCSTKCTTDFLEGTAKANCPQCGHIPGGHSPGCPAS